MAKGADARGGCVHKSAIAAALLLACLLYTSAAAVLEKLGSADARR